MSRGNPVWVERRYVDEWAKLSSMRRLWEVMRRRNLKPSTFRVYIKDVRSFINFAGYEDPGEFIEAIRGDHVVFDELADKYIEAHKHLQNSVVQKRVKRTQLWLKANLDIKNGEGEKISLEAVELPRGNQKAKVKDAAPTRLELKELVGFMKNTRDKAICLAASSSGLRPETLFSLDVGDVEFSFEVTRVVNGKPKIEKVEDIAKINITPGPGRKVSSEYYTFITSEAKDLLQQYLEERQRVGEIITSKSPLWVTHFDVNMEKENKRPLKRLSYDTWSLQWRRILRRARKDATSHAEDRSWFWYKFHLKTLRKFFRTEVTNARVIEDLKYFWMGQPAGVYRPEYYRDHLDVAVDEYRRLIPFLSVEKVPMAQEDLEKRDAKIASLEKQLADLAERLEKQHVLGSLSPGARVLISQEELTQIVKANRRMLRLLEEHGLVTDE